MIVVVYSDGQINISDINLDFREKKWIPIAVLKNDLGEIFVPYFNTFDTAKSFSKRNFPKNWLVGAIHLSDDEVEFIISKGWKAMNLNYPKLFTNHQELKIDFEIIDFHSKPIVLYS